MRYWFAFFLGMVNGYCITSLALLEEPKSMDVYQGKTTLEYKVVDGEIVDSCVVCRRRGVS